MAANEYRELDPRDTKELPIVLRCLDLVTIIVGSPAHRAGGGGCRCKEKQPVGAQAYLWYVEHQMDVFDAADVPASARECRDEPTIMVVTWLMETTARMPKHWRPTLVQRIDHEAQEVLLLLTEASYRRRKADVLRRANLSLSRLRMLLELALRLKALAPGAHGHALVALDEVGRMLGGWLRSVTRREGRGGCSAGGSVP
jgi:hypothetical protein